MKACVVQHDPLGPPATIFMGSVVLAGKRSPQLDLLTVDAPLEKKRVGRVIGISPEYPATRPRELHAVLT